MARTRASMNKEEDPTSLVLGVRNLDISFPIVRKRKKKNKDDKEGPSKKERPRYKKPASETHLGQE